MGSFDRKAALDLLDRCEALTDRWAAKAEAAPNAMHGDGGFGLGYAAGLEAALDDLIALLADLGGDGE